MNQDELKQAVAQAALDYVVEGEIVGVGTGSTVNHFIDALATMKDEIKGAVSSSIASTERLKGLGIPVFDLNDIDALSVYVDGADEINASRDMIKGGGAALTREKIVAAVADQFICIIDNTKTVDVLGTFPLPVEIIPFGWQTTKALIEELLVGLDVLDRNVTLRMNGDRPLLTDEANYILDLHLRRIGNPRQVALVLNQIPGVVENGLFIDICDIVIIGHGDGRVTVRDINEGTERDDRILFAPPRQHLRRSGRLRGLVRRPAPPKSAA